MSMLIFFTILFILAVYFLYMRKGLTASVFLFSLYATSFICSTLFVLFGFFKENPKISDYSGGLLFLFLALLVFLYPFYKIDDKNIDCLIIPSKGVLYPIITIFTIWSLFSFIWYLPVAIKMLSVNTADIANTRSMVTLGLHPYIQPSTTNVIAHMGALFYGLQLYFFFLLILIKKKIDKWCIIVLISSFSYPIFVFAYMGRDGAVFWTMALIANYLLYGRLMRNNAKKLVKRFGLIVISIFILMFVIITIGRFYMNPHQDSLISTLLSYGGQGPLNFAEVFFTGVQKSGYGKNMFPLLFGEASNYGYALALERYGINTWVFKTFISSIYLEFGLFGTFFVGLFLAVLYRLSFVKTKMRKAFTMSFSIIYLLFFMIYSTGIFYFLYSYPIANMWIVIMLTLAIIVNFVPMFKIQIEK